MSKHSLAGKLLAIGLVAVALWGASLLVLSLVTEREKARPSVAGAISRPWGGAQTLAAPFLAIPYKQASGDKESPWKTWYIMPEQLDIFCEVNPEIQRRDLFQAVVYTSKIHVSGHFTLPNPRQFGVKEAMISLWRAKPSVGMPSEYIAYLAFGTSSGFHSLHKLSNVLFNSSPVGKQSAYSQNVPFAEVAAGLAVALPFPPADDPGLDEHRPTIPFSFDLELTGSEAIKFAPLGQRTNISMRSNWPQPMLIGQYPPQQFEKRNGDGFSANWSIDSDTYPHDFMTKEGELDKETFLSGKTFADFPSAGIRFFDSLDEHHKVERVTKYAALFILFTFAAFFIAEVRNHTLVHPIQYLMVGGAIVIFYLLLLSICEHAGFTIAYLVSALATVTIITLYAWSALRSPTFAAMAGALLCILYGYFYITTQMEDYALLAGSLALFVILAAAMYFTRKIDWYGLGDNAD